MFYKYNANLFIEHTWELKIAHHSKTHVDYDAAFRLRSSSSHSIDLSSIEFCFAYTKKIKKIKQKYEKKTGNKKVLNITVWKKTKRVDWQPAYRKCLTKLKQLTSYS